MELKNIFLFEGLSEDTIKSIEAISRIEKLNKGNILF